MATVLFGGGLENRRAFWGSRAATCQSRRRQRSEKRLPREQGRCTQITNQSDWGTASFGGTTLGMDGIQEYKVLTSVYDASYGMTMAARW